MQGKHEEEEEEEEEATAAAAAEEEDAAALWGSVGSSIIPLDLTWRILTRLPLVPHLFRLRLVSRSWNALLSAPDFLHLWWQCNTGSHCWIMAAPPMPSPPPSSLTLHHDGGDPNDNLWRCLQRRFNTPLVVFFISRINMSSSCWFPLRRHRFRLPNMEIVSDVLNHVVKVRCPVPVPAMRILAGGAASLIAEFAFYDNLGQLLRVFNFLSGSCRNLPLPLALNCIPSPNNSFFEWHGPWCSYRLSESYKPHLLLSHDRQYYYLVLCGGQEGRMYVNDSRRPDSWIAVSGIHVMGCTHEPELLPPPALFEGHNIFEADLFYPLFPQDTLFAYRVESDQWSKAVAQFPTVCKVPGRPECPTVTKLQGSRILLAAALFTEDRVEVQSPLRMGQVLDGFVVWELQRADNSYLWVEVARTPKQLAELHHATVDFTFSPKFVNSNALICMTSAYYSRGRCMPPLVYDLSLDSWYYLPPYKDTQQLLVLCSFEPAFPGLLP